MRKILFRPVSSEKRLNLLRAEREPVGFRPALQS